MPDVPECPTILAGDIPDAADWQDVKAAIDFGQHGPGFRLRQTSTQTLTTSVWTSLTYTVEDLDDDPDGTGGHSTSVNTSRFTARYTGWYPVGGVAGFAANATGGRMTRWAINGTALNASCTLMPSAGAGNSTHCAANADRVFLTEGDYLELQGLQASGGNLATIATGEFASSMNGHWERRAA